MELEDSRDSPAITNAFIRRLAKFYEDIAPSSVLIFFRLEVRLYVHSPSPLRNVLLILVQKTSPHQFGSLLREAQLPIFLFVTSVQDQ